MIPENIVHSLTLLDAGTKPYKFVRERPVLFNEGQRRLYYTFWSIWNDDIRKILQMYVGRLKDGADLLLTKYKIHEP